MQRYDFSSKYTINMVIDLVGLQFQVHSGTDPTMHSKPYERCCMASIFNLTWWTILCQNCVLA